MAEAKNTKGGANQLRTVLILSLSAVVLVAAGTIIALRAITPQYPDRTPSNEILVDAQWLEDNLDSVVILDSARSNDDFLNGHIPGAALVGRSTTWDTVEGIAGMLPDPEVVAQDLADAGVSNDTPVVVYDAGNGLWASRLFWALEYLGHSNVHLLDGGFASWQEAGKEVATTPQVPQRGDFTANPQPLLIADKDYLIENLGNEQLAILDTRSPDEYTGVDVRAERGGHIPTSINIEWTQNLNQAGSFKTFSELADLYESAISGETGPAVTLCQTGVRGAHTYVVLRTLGHNQARVYDGSWAEWGNDPGTPIDL